MDKDTILFELRKYIHKLEIKFAEQQKKDELLKTENKKLLRKLSKQLAEKNIILTAAMEGFAIVSEDGKIQFINDVFSDIFGMDGQQLINQHFYSLEINGTEAEFKKKIEAVKLKKNILFSTYIQTPVSIKSIDASLNFFIIQNQSFIFLLLKDTTEDRIKEIQLEKTERSFSNLIESLPDIVYKLDEKGKFTYLNESIKMLGYEPDELIGKHFSQIVHPDDIKKVSRYYALPEFSGKITGSKNAPKLFDERRSGDRRTVNLQLRLIPKTENNNTNRKPEKIGNVISWGEVSASGHYLLNPNNNKNEFIGTIGIIRNITERVHEESSLKLNADLYISIVESQTELIARYLPNGKIIFANRAFGDYYRIPADKLIGYNIFNFMMSKDAQLLKIRLADLTVSASSISYNYRSVIANSEKMSLHFRTDTAVYGSNGELLCYQSVERSVE